MNNNWNKAKIEIVIEASKNRRIIIEFQKLKKYWSDLIST